MQDRIEKTIELSAPVARVWCALTNHKEFGQWFRVELHEPFRVGEVCHGRVTFPGYEGMKWEALIVAMEPETLFAFKWCPYAHEPDIDYATQPQTLVEFRLQPTSNGTRLSISESGFASLPADERRFDALRSNTQGWDTQMRNLVTYVEA